VWSKDSTFWLENDFLYDPSFSKIKSCEHSPVFEIKGLIDRGQDVCFECKFIYKWGELTITSVGYFVSIINSGNEVTARVYGSLPEKPAYIKAFLTLLEVMVTKKTPSFLFSNSVKIGTAAVASVVVGATILKFRNNPHRRQSEAASVHDSHLADLVMSADSDVARSTVAYRSVTQVDPTNIPINPHDIIKMIDEYLIFYPTFEALEGCINWLNEIASVFPKCKPTCSAKVTELSILLETVKGKRDAIGKIVKDALLAPILNAIKALEARSSDLKSAYEYGYELSTLNSLRKQLEDYGRLNTRLFSVGGCCAGGEAVLLNDAIRAGMKVFKNQKKIKEQSGGAEKTHRRVQRHSWLLQNYNAYYSDYQGLKAGEWRFR